MHFARRVMSRRYPITGKSVEFTSAKRAGHPRYSHSLSLFFSPPTLSFSLLFLPLYILLILLIVSSVRNIPRIMFLRTEKRDFADLNVAHGFYI